MRMSKPSGIISNRKVEALHPATLKGRGFTAGQGKKSTEEDISRHETEISQLKQKIEEFKQFLPLLDKKELLRNTSIEFSIEELKELHQQVVLFEQHPILSRI